MQALNENDLEGQLSLIERVRLGQFRRLTTGPTSLKTEPGNPIPGLGQHLDQICT